MLKVLREKFDNRPLLAMLLRLITTSKFSCKHFDKGSTLSLTSSVSKGR